MAPLVLTVAFGLGQADPEAGVRAACPDAAADEAEVAKWAGEQTGTWQRRFDGPRSCAPWWRDRNADRTRSTRSAAAPADAAGEDRFG